jgi:SAM-dependent methyltransferase
MNIMGGQFNPEKGKKGRLKVYDLKGAIPFSGQFTADLDRPNNRHRLKVYRKFMGWDTVPEGLEVLDIGKPSFISRAMEIKYNTVGDLNRGITVRPTASQFDVITSFEVIAHLMNPLLHAQACYELLKPGGVMYLATPKQWLIPWYHGLGNFVEYKKDRMQTLLQYAGFTPVRYSEHSPWPWFFIFYGFRPPIRYLLNRFQLWELRKDVE